ncbi:holin family protein [Geomicrobium sp. JCM 19055]|uniref:phage holin family protein n=1 Tax=Geomicrobium sp. JCM 19055 TaxID=1460649 RepID=UPI00045ED2BC|nr:phage holin family protein [Geomicrobium sp. JCM 19055]GAK01523.1 holin, toxin secretion/phage lysis [Geomicrobium sp. JCM 19055]
MFGGWSVLIGALILFITFDYLTGIAAAFYRGELNPRVGFWGIPKKVFIFGVVALAHMIDKVYIDQMGDPLVFGEFEISVMVATIIYYLFNEFISICENLGRMDMNVPIPLAKAMDILKGQSYYEDKRRDNHD